MPFGLSVVTRYVFTNNRPRELGTLGAVASVDDMPARRRLTPRYSRYKPPAHLTAVNQTAEVASSAPRPKRDTSRAVESPSATAATRGTFARRPCDME